MEEQKKYVDKHIFSLYTLIHIIIYIISQDAHINIYFQKNYSEYNNISMKFAVI